MRAVELIIKKRDGGCLSREELEFLIRGYLAGTIEDYQMSAWLMAVFLRGMTAAETADLTRAMMHSGETYRWPRRNGRRPVDKHSTGGVGDKVSLALAPLAAACGVPVPMVSGRGLGHTGGTLDKLESIPGFQVRVERQQFERQLADIGVVMAGQTDNFVPADKRLYALRDVTGTVESVPLICASILSKKAASGAEALVMDVKCGSGAFMKTLDHARELACGLIDTGESLGLPVRVMITDMSQPLGRLVGNALEVMEAIDCLQGGGPADLRELVIEQAAVMICLAQEREGADDLAAAREKARANLDGGAGWEKFLALVEAQGGDPRALEDTKRLDISPDQTVLTAGQAGWVQAMDCAGIGGAAVVLGAGRNRLKDPVDPGVGLEMLVRLGDRVEAGTPLVRVWHRAGRGLEDCLTRLRSAIIVGAQPATAPPLIIERLPQPSER
jgi:pyrimidine-nucleoside phosphorylase